MRIVQNVACRAVSGQGYTAMRQCAQIDSDGVLPKSVIESFWPECNAYFTGSHLDQQVLVRANYYGLPIEINVAISIVSGASAFVALFLHAMGVEVYVSSFGFLSHTVSQLRATWEERRIRKKLTFGHSSN